ncbi:MAG: lytic transglycosylase domain-containing protein [bacterium]
MAGEINLNKDLHQSINQSKVDVGTSVSQQKRYLLTAYSADEQNPYVKKVFISSLSIAAVTIVSVILMPIFSATNISNKNINNEGNSTFKLMGNIQTQDILNNINILKQPMSRMLDAENKAEQEKAKAAAELAYKPTSTNKFFEIYSRAEVKFGVPKEILAAVHYIETRQSDDTTIVSSAGALGPMQFMPATFSAYAQDGDGDGVKSIFNVSDAIFSAANNLATNGASTGKMYQALYNYNHSDEYVKKVLDKAKVFGYKELPVVIAPTPLPIITAVPVI